MLFSTAGYALFSRSTDTTTPIDSTENPYYNGQYWVFTYSGLQFYFFNSPQQVENVSVDPSINLGDYQNVPVFIASDSPVFAQQIASVMSTNAERLQEACYGVCESLDLPEKDCTSKLIVWKEAPENKVYKQDNCVFVEGDSLAVDAFLYQLLGVK